MQDIEKKRDRTWLRVALLYSRTFRGMTERLAPLGLSVAQFDLLACLVAAEPAVLKQSDLAHRLLVTKGNISGMLSRMTELGTVERVDDPNDKRSKRITITEQGRDLYLQGKRVQSDFVEEIFRELDPGRLKHFEEVVSELCEKLSSIEKSDRKGA